MQWEIDVLPAVKQVVKQFKATGVYHPTIRAVYYKLYSMGAIPENSPQMYKGLLKMLTRLRMSLKDDDIGPQTFADESRAAPHVNDIKTLDEMIQDEVDYARAILDGNIALKPNRWTRQPKYIEVWTEKQAMYSTFASILKGYDVAIQASKGFNSISMLYQAALRLRHHKYSKDYYNSKTGESKEAIVLYFGDLDPSGDSMDDDIQSKLRHFGVSVKFIRVAVNPDQVEEYNLPAAPDENTARRLRQNDSRTRGFMSKYGRLYAIELDALAGQEADKFKELVINAVEEHFDEDIWQKVQDEYQENKVTRKLRKASKEQIVQPILDKSKKQKSIQGEE